MAFSSCIIDTYRLGGLCLKVLSVTFDSLWYKNLSKVLEISIECIKLLGSYVQQEVHSESLRVEHSIVSVSMVGVCNVLCDSLCL